jgi:hypothetical protein
MLDKDELMAFKLEASPATWLIAIVPPVVPVPPITPPEVLPTLVTLTCDSVTGVALGGTAHISLQVVSPSLLL